MNKALLTYISLMIACVVVVAAFITATNYVQLGIAAGLYILLSIFVYLALKRSPNDSTSSQNSYEQSATIQADSIGVSDFDKRTFLKLVGGAGLFLFLFSIFNRRVENLFFKNVPGAMPNTLALEDSSGNKIDPALNQPLDGYIITELEDDLVAFYGFTNKDGGWYVMRIDTTAGSFRYCRGATNFPNNWENRENLQYDYYNNVF